MLKPIIPSFQYSNGFQIPSFQFVFSVLTVLQSPYFLLSKKHPPTFTLWSNLQLLHRASPPPRGGREGGVIWFGCGFCRAVFSVTYVAKKTEKNRMGPSLGPILFPLCCWESI